MFKLIDPVHKDQEVFISLQGIESFGQVPISLSYDEDIYTENNSWFNDKPQMVKHMLDLRNVTRSYLQF